MRYPVPIIHPCPVPSPTEPQTSAVPTPRDRGFRNISDREYLRINFSVIAAENPRLCDFLPQLFVCGIPGVGELGP